jgi:hypothetical protein
MSEELAKYKEVSEYNSFCSICRKLAHKEPAGVSEDDICEYHLQQAYALHKTELTALRAENARLKDELAKLKAFWEWSRLADKELFQIDYAIEKHGGEGEINGKRKNKILKELRVPSLERLKNRRPITDEDVLGAPNDDLTEPPK